RSLGRIQVEPASSTIGPLGGMLGSESRTDHRAAAEALNNIVRILPQVRRTRSLETATGTGSGFAVPRKIRIEASEALVPAAGKALGDADPEVRRLCADTLLQTALVLSSSDLIAPVLREQEYPPPGRQLTEAEKKRIDFIREDVVREREELARLLTAFRELAPELAQAAADREGAVRVLAIRTLEELGLARQQLLWREASVPRYRAIDGT